jgi:hypothetical protein
MPNINERPVCHRAEDLVTYLYGEANEVDAKDFAGHLQQCDACRSEFGVFQQVHDSILLWRNEALGSAFSPATVPVESTVDSTQYVRHERKLTALAALREFLSVSPLWLRAATGFATLLLCVLGVLVISRSWNRPTQIASSDTETKYSKQQVDELVKVQVDKKIAELRDGTTAAKPPESGTPNQSVDTGSRVAVNRVQPKAARPRGLNRQEREQLAADLRLISSRDDEELPFVFSDEPNQ